VGLPRVFGLLFGAAGRGAAGGGVGLLAGSAAVVGGAAGAGGGGAIGRGASAAELAAGGALATRELPLAHQTTVAAMPITRTTAEAMSATIAGRDERAIGAPETTVGKGPPFM
jgi:hypothetical protein